MGCEIMQKNFFKFDDLAYLERYVARGKHHIKWSRNDRQQMGHLDMLVELVKRYPSRKSDMMEPLLKYSSEEAREILTKLTEFTVPGPVSTGLATQHLDVFPLRLSDRLD